MESGEPELPFPLFTIFLFYFGKSEKRFSPKFYFAAGLYSFLSITILAIKKLIFAKTPIPLLCRRFVLLLIDHHFGKSEKSIFAKTPIPLLCRRLVLLLIDHHFGKSEKRFSPKRRSHYFAAGLYSFLSITILANRKNDFRQNADPITLPQACTPSYRSPFWR